MPTPKKLDHVIPDRTGPYRPVYPQTCRRYKADGGAVPRRHAIGEPHAVGLVQPPVKGCRVLPVLGVLRHSPGNERPTVETYQAGLDRMKNASSTEIVDDEIALPAERLDDTLSVRKLALKLT